MGNRSSKRKEVPKEIVSANSKGVPQSRFNAPPKLIINTACDHVGSEAHHGSQDSFRGINNNIRQQQYVGYDNSTQMVHNANFSRVYQQNSTANSSLFAVSSKEHQENLDLFTTKTLSYDNYRDKIIPQPTGTRSVGIQSEIRENDKTWDELSGEKISDNLLHNTEIEQNYTSKKFINKSQNNDNYWADLIGARPTGTAGLPYKVQIVTRSKVEGLQNNSWYELISPRPPGRAFRSTKPLNDHRETNKPGTVPTLTQQQIIDDERDMWRQVNEAEGGRWGHVRRAYKGQKYRYYCHLCDAPLISTTNAIEHAYGKTHQARLTQKWARETPEEGFWRKVPRPEKFNRDYIITIDGGHFECAVCNADIPFAYQNLLTHIRGKRHSENLLNRR